MLAWFVRTILKFRYLIALFLLALLFGGYWMYRTLPRDAFPDVSPVMVPIFAEAPGMAPEEVERFISHPVESVMNGLPGVTLVKSTSAFGMATIYVYFEDDVDIYFARQLVGERLNRATSMLPETVEPPTLGPISSGLGQIFIYYLKADANLDTGGEAVLTYLRNLNDTVVKYQLSTVPGVTDILSMGGAVRQYDVRLDANKMQKYELSYDDIRQAIQANNRNVGGQYLAMGGEEYLVRGVGIVTSLDDLALIPVKNDGVSSVLLGDVAQIVLGSELRRGVVTRNGEEEVVAGMVLKLYGENSSAVIAALHKKLDQVRQTLPKGVSIETYYDQSDLVDKAASTVEQSLGIGMLLVLLVLLVFLRSLRAAIIVALSMPFCAALALLAMKWFGFSANLMSLGGIAIALGMLVDGSLIVAENILHLLSKEENRNRKFVDIVIEAVGEVGRPICFAIIIIMAVFIPLFCLTDYEGKMFHPMAFAIVVALGGSIFAAGIAVPALAALFHLKPVRSKFDPLLWVGRLVYLPLLAVVLKHRILAFCAMAALIGYCGWTLPRIGREFMPLLEEGTVLISVSMAPSISLDNAQETITRMEKIIRKHPDVAETVSRIGRPEAGSHPHPVNFAEIQIRLKEPAERTQVKDRAELVEALRSELQEYPGVNLNFTQPIQNAFDELLSGIKAVFAIKLYGDDMDVLRTKSEEIRRKVSKVPGVVDLSVEQSFGQPQIQVIPDREKMAARGVNAEDVLELIEGAVGGESVGDFYENTRKYAIQLRLDEEFRTSPEALKALTVRGSDGAVWQLGDVADVVITEGPVQINRENGRRRWIVQGNIADRALSDIVTDMRKIIAEEVDLPPGYSVEFGGQFANQERAMKALMWIIPIVVAGILLLLILAFGNVRSALIVFFNVPLALTGGVLALDWGGVFLSVPAAVGFIALLGIAMQDAVVMVSDFGALRKNGMSLSEAIHEGAFARFRAVVLTTLTTLLGLLPLLVSHGAGAEIQRPLALIVVVGLSGSTLLTLFFLPCVYAVVEGRFGGKKEVAEPVANK